MNDRDHEGIPEELIRSAFRTGEELAWKRDDCRRAIEWLQSSGYGAWGTELWLPDGQNIRTEIKTKTEPAIYGTACDLLERERWDDSVDCYTKSAIESITSYCWPEDGVGPPCPAYFNITWASRQWFREHDRDNFAED